MASAVLAEIENPVAHIIRELETARALPRAALAAAGEHINEIEPLVIQLLEHAAAGALLIPKQANLLFFGLHALAAARRSALYRPLLRLARNIPEDELEWLLGSATSEMLAPMLLAVCDGDPAPLIDVVMDRSADSFTRWTVWEVLARLTFDGVLERTAMVALLDRFEREGLAPNDDPAWKGWQEAIILLGIEELRERLRATWRDGRNPERAVDQAANEEALSASQAAPGDPSRFDERFLAALGDLEQALARFEWVEGNPAKAVASQNGVGAIVEIEPDEAEWMDRFLGRRFGDSDLAWEAIDGFCCGLAVGPAPVDPRDRILAAVDFGKPMQFDTSEQAVYVTGLLLRHYNTIIHRLKSGQWHHPILATSDMPGASLWAIFFLRAVSRRKSDWEGKERDQMIGLSLQTMMMLAGSELEGWRSLNRRTRGEMVELLPLMLRALYDAWHGGRDPLARRPIPTSFAPKIGRNDPCLCGSGRKFTRCCGSAERMTAL
jgi:yecA family protein